MNSSSGFQLLVIDDDQLIIDSLAYMLPKNWSMTSCKSFSEIKKNSFFHAAFVDQHLSGNLNKAEGVQEIKKINEHNSKIEIVAMSGDMSLELMENCLASGASKFLVKPLGKDEVLATLEKIEALWLLRETETRGGKKTTQWMGTGPASELIKKRIASLKGEEGPILIEGETGTGKEVAFWLLNQQESPRPAVTVNIAAIPENLFESELFGHVRGAFTGADSMKVGLCEAAHGGDLFLDEIEALPLSLQVKLLRFLEAGEVRKVGAKETTHVKTRVIVASNQNLSELVRSGQFREDLLFRLSGKKINLPPLRERKEDIQTLAQFFLSQQRPRSNKMLSPDALQSFQNYSWPGNVRELKRICEQLALTSPLPILRAEDVLNILQPLDSKGKKEEINFELGLAKLVENFETQVLQRILSQEKDLEKVATKLKISRSNLYKKLKDYSLQGDL